MDTAYSNPHPLPTTEQPLPIDMGFVDFEKKGRRVLDRSRCPGLRMLDTLNENSYSEGVANISATDNGDLEQKQGEDNDIASSPEGPTTSLMTTPVNEFFPTIPATLQHCSAVKHLLKSDINKANIGSSSVDFAEFLDFVTSTDAIRQLYDALLVWLYDSPNRYFMVVQQTKLSIIHTTVVVLLEVKSTRLQPPQWLAVVLETYNNGRPGRWIGEISIEWVDTSWRTAHSVLHVGAVSPVATLPWLDPVRLQALCFALRRFVAGGGSSSIPIREHTGQKKRPPPPSNPSRKSSDAGKKPRQNSGGGPAKPPGDSSEERDGTKPGRRQTKNKIENTLGLPWACPLYKKDPIRYMECLFHSLTESRHVKRHLLRHHKQPTHCPTCYERFSTKASCDQHITRRVCDPSPAPEGWDMFISEDARVQIEGTAGGNWFAMWDIIYPGITRPQTPFLEFANLIVDAQIAIGNDRSGPFRQELENIGLNGVQIQSVMEAYSRTFALGSQSTNSNSSNTANPSPSHPIQLHAEEPSQQHGHNVRGHSHGAPPQSHGQSANHMSQQRHHQAYAAMGGNSLSTFSAPVHGQQVRCLPPQQGQNEAANSQDIPMYQESLETQRLQQHYIAQQQRAQQQQRERQHVQQQQQQQQQLLRRRQQLVQMQQQQHEAELHARAVNADGFPPTNLRYQQAISTVDQQRRQLHQQQRDGLWQRTFGLSAGHQQQNTPQHHLPRQGMNAPAQTLPQHPPQRQRQQPTPFPTQGTRMQRFPSTSASSASHTIPSQRTHSHSNHTPTNLNNGTSLQPWAQWNDQTAVRDQQQQFIDEFMTMLETPAAPQASSFNNTRQSAGGHGSAYSAGANAASSPSPMLPQQVMMRDDTLPFIDPALLNNHAMSPGQPHATQPPPTPAPTDFLITNDQFQALLDDLGDVVSLNGVEEESFMKIDPVEDEDEDGEEDSDDDDEDGEEASDDES